MSLRPLAFLPTALCLVLIASFSAPVTIVHGNQASPPNDGRAEAVALFYDDQRLAAKPHFEKIIEQNPRDGDALYYLAAINAMGGDWERAIPLAERSVAADPGSARFQYGLGQACGLAALKSGLLSRYGYAKRSRTAYEKAVQLDPKSLRFREALINYYILAPSVVGGGIDKAYAQAREMKAIDPVAGALCLAEVLNREKKFAEAFAELEGALALAAEDYLVLYRLGRLAGSTGQRMDEGLAWLDRCLQKPAPLEGPRRHHILVRRGSLLEKKSDRDGARAAYEAALQLVPDYGPARGALAKLNGAGSPPSSR